MSVIKSKTLLNAACKDVDESIDERIFLLPDSLNPLSDGCLQCNNGVRITLVDDVREEAPENGFRPEHHLSVMEDDVLAAITATPPGSATGLDGIRPLHLSQLIAEYTVEVGHRLLSALTELCYFTIAGNIPEHTREAFFGASLTAIKKKDGGMRPIVVGSIYRRLASKLLAKRMSSTLAAELNPFNWVGTPDMAIIKLDLSNAFNTVRISAILREVAAPLVSQAYSQPSPLHFGSNHLWSCHGVQ
ncbi:hypothetical protein O3P69_018082 [Scylla paramamosain]|uniref:Reverse transcriptase domain-containing protein n=1 Tax=Scylla paramamosain TaxID=85552 RepID=A0AAW0THM6_SCYPA